MKYALNDLAGSCELIVSGDEYKYLVKVRRHTIGDLIIFRNRNALEIAHTYRLEKTDRNNGYFTLEHSKKEICESSSKLHIGWCIVDPKTIEKTLPMLLELGVAKITLLHCKRSQKNFRLDFERFKRIMESSMMQCGRTSFIELQESPNVSTFLNIHSNAVILDFGGEVLDKNEKFDTVVIGCEGGFDESEKKLFSTHRLRHFSNPMVLRSETAVVAIASIGA
jgi:16S rRNA (uracil1498-N3)-methyltransferase